MAGIGTVPHRRTKGAWSRARRPQTCKLTTRPELRDIVAEKLAARWSPQQIAGWLKTTYPNDAEMQVSHETIYRTRYDRTVLVGRPNARAVGFIE